MTTRRKLGHLVVAAALAGGAPVALAATYKWVDDKGVVHYTDKIPPEQVDKANVQLDKQGVPVKRTEPAPTSEEKRAKAEAEAREKQLAKERELVDRRDRALLSTYTMESEIDLARRRALATIDQQIQSSAAYTVQLTKRRDELEAKKAPNQGPASVTEREIANINTELARQADLVEAKQKEVVLVNVRYDADLKRWRELRAATEAQANATAIKAAAEAKAAKDAPPKPGTTAQK